jgi:hypothetical protein
MKATVSAMLRGYQMSVGQASSVGEIFFGRKRERFENKKKRSEKQKKINTMLEK